MATAKSVYACLIRTVTVEYDYLCTRRFAMMGSRKSRPTSGNTAFLMIQGLYVSALVCVNRTRRDRDLRIGIDEMNSRCGMAADRTWSQALGTERQIQWAARPKNRLVWRME
jgi:hypothetical protein